MRLFVSNSYVWLLVYVDVSDALDRKIFLTVVGLGNEARSFRIKVTQIMEAKSPPDCLQFYEGKTGFIKSFNYDDVSKIVRKRVPSYFVSIEGLIKEAIKIALSDFKRLGPLERNSKRLGASNSSFKCRFEHLTAASSTLERLRAVPSGLVGLRAVSSCLKRPQGVSK